MKAGILICHANHRFIWYSEGPTARNQRGFQIALFSHPHDSRIAVMSRVVQDLQTYCSRRASSASISSLRPRRFPKPPMLMLATCWFKWNMQPRKRLPRRWRSTIKFPTSISDPLKSAMKWSNWCRSPSRENTVLPFSEEDGALRILIADPFDLETIEKLRFILNRKIETALASRVQSSVRSTVITVRSR